MSLNNKSMSHPSDHSSASQQEHYSRSLGHLIMTSLHLSPLPLTPLALLDTLLQDDPSTIERLLLLKMVFKFDHLVHPNIDYPALLLLLDQYLLTPHPGHSLVLLMAKNIINRTPSLLPGNYQS